MESFYDKIHKFKKIQLQTMIIISDVSFSHSENIHFLLEIDQIIK